MSKLHIENLTITIHQATPGIPGVAAALTALQSLEATPIQGHAMQTAAPGTRLAIGTYWPGQGGFYAGDMRGDDGQVYGLIVSDCGPEQDAGRSKWGPAAKHELSEWDGLANTRALGETHPAAKLAASHAADEHQDFYLPARRELQLAAANVPHLFGTADWYWSSTPRTESYAWAVDFERGITYYDYRYREFRVRPVRRFIY